MVESQKPSVLTVYVIASVLIVIGAAALGAIKISSSVRLVAWLHYGMAFVFVGLVLAGLFLQYRRVKMKGKMDWVVWLHMVMFGLFVYLSSAAAFYHARKMKLVYGNTPQGGGGKATLLSNNEQLLVKYKGDTIDLTNFANEHPGGSVIWQAQGKDVEEVWKKMGQQWHANNDRVKQVLKNNIVVG